jgi:hypothetical protein
MTPLSISVVVASGAGGEFLFRCLSSLDDQAASLGADIIVADRTGAATCARLAREFPRVRVIPVNPSGRPTVPQLRRVGVEAATADVVAILEEHCTAPPGWLKTIQNHFRRGDAAIGGPICDDSFRRVRDWVVYFSEYHNFMPPWFDGPRAQLNGANIAYDRATLIKHREILDSGYWEVVLHPRIARDGAFRAVNAMGVHHTGPFDYRYYLRQRYLLSRVWGGTQRDREPLTRRFVHLAAGPLFPLFLFARVTSRVVPNRRLTRKYIPALPLLIPVWIAYAWGEWLGYLRGPGTALEDVE